jgi:hypothetical protein
MWRFGIVFLFSMLAIAQNTPRLPGNLFQIGDPRLSGNANLSGDFLNPQLLQNSHAAQQNSFRPQMQMAKHRIWKDPMQLQPADNVCYAIRSYIFTREDSRAPVLVKTTTCTHVLLGFQKAVQPRVLLVPAN